MKVLLATTTPEPESISIDNYIGLSEPLALEYLGAGIRENHDVKLLDLRVDTEPGLKDTLESFQPDILGVGGFTIDVNPVKKLLAEAKRISPHLLTVVGGHHATILPQDFFNENIDVVVIGEGVAPFKKICDHHEKQKSFEPIENIYYRKKGTNGKMLFTTEKDYPPLDSLPFPDRSLTSHIRDKYTVPFTSAKPQFASIRGSLGCIYRCNFCAITSILKHKQYTHSIDRIIEEIAAIPQPILSWLDDEFFIQHERAVTLAKEINRAGIKKFHRLYARADHIVNHPECIEEWAKNGLQFVLVGLESHRENDLKKMRKGSSVPKNEEAIRVCHANNVKVRGNFIILPEYSKDDIKELIGYIRKLGIDFPSFSVLTPLPGTPLYEESKDNFITNNLNLVDGVHTLLPTKLPLKQFYKEISRAMSNSVSFWEKRKLIKQVEPKWRRKCVSCAVNYNKRVKNAYRDYQD